MIPDLPSTLRPLVDAFDDAGHALYLVGGCVRDRLLDRPVHDWDFCTDARPEQIKALAAACAPDALHTLGEKLGSMSVRYGTIQAEITTFRGERYDGVSRDPVVRFGVTLEEDLARRDFTINAIAQDVQHGTLIDPHAGREDLKHQVIRAVGVPDDRFAEDPLRLLRAVRFAAQLGFLLSYETRIAVARCASQLQRIVPDRIGDELEKIMAAPGVLPVYGLLLLKHLDLLPAALPELGPTIDLGQNTYHTLPVWEHTVETLRQVCRISPAPPLRWAALLHDVGKPATRTVDADGHTHFYGHDIAGAALAEQALTRLARSPALKQPVVALVSLHLRPHHLAEGSGAPGIRRLLRDCAAARIAVDDLLVLATADALTHAPAHAAHAVDRLAHLRVLIEHIRHIEPAQRYDSPLDGHQIVALAKRPPGPWVGEAKRYLAEQVIEGTLADPPAALTAWLCRRFPTEDPHRFAPDGPPAPVAAKTR